MLPADPRRRTIMVQIIFASIEDFIAGFFVLAEVILRRELLASPFVITIFTMIASSSSLFSVYFSHLLTANPDKILKYIKYVAIITRLPLLLFLVWHTASSMLILMGLFYLGIAFIKPVQTISMKENLRKGEMGNIYGYSVSIGRIFFLISTYFFGMLMDLNNNMFIYIFAISGAIAFFSIFIFRYVSFDEFRQEEKDLEKLDPFILPTLIKTFKKNHDFFIFEVAFFIYGGGFMVVLAAIPILLVDYLNLSYSVISFGRGVVASATIVLLTPFFGKIFDRKSPVSLGKMIFMILTLYPAMMIAAYFFRPHFTELLFYLSFLFFGVGMAGVTIIWNIGPMVFAKNYSEMSKYTSVHVTMTGVRGLIMPLFGYFLLKISIVYPFYASFLMFLISSLIMGWLQKKGSYA